MPECSSEPVFNKLLHHYPRMANAIQDGFAAKRSKDELAVNLLGAMLTDIIEHADLDRRRGIPGDIHEWGSSPDAIPRMRADVAAGHTPDQMDALRWRLQAAIVYVSDLCEAQAIDHQTEEARRR